MPSKQRHKEKHQHCEMELRTKAQHIGLYCKEHNKWIQWVDKSTAQQLMTEYDLILGEET